MLGPANLGPANLGSLLLDPSRVRLIIAFSSSASSLSVKLTFPLEYHQEPLPPLAHLHRFPCPFYYYVQLSNHHLSFTKIQWPLQGSGPFWLCFWTRFCSIWSRWSPIWNFLKRYNGLWPVWVLCTWASKQAATGPLNGLLAGAWCFWQCTWGHFLSPHILPPGFSWKHLWAPFHSRKHAWGFQTSQGTWTPCFLWLLNYCGDNFFYMLHVYALRGFYLLVKYRHYHRELGRVFLKFYSSWRLLSP